ncbi:hypothetical protein AB6A40_001268 [Gnathostoma spinigerum]|uniref:Integrator complex subunit 5 N-terminal domain-containing protein n=1 Tax=Gnathostoma spinigerum TaxID=75299 RepID=A0ABD6E8S5_9BILA
MDTVYVDSDLSNDSYGFQSKAERHVIGDFGSVNDAIDQFMSIANVADVASLYRNRPVWANSPVPSLVNPAAKVFAQFPCARCAVLHYIGLLTHEATHIYFSQKENPHFGKCEIFYYIRV